MEGHTRDFGLRRPRMTRLGGYCFVARYMSRWLTMTPRKVCYYVNFRTSTSKICAHGNVRPRLPGHIGRPPGGLPDGTTPVSRAPRVADFSSTFGPQFARPASTETNQQKNAAAAGRYPGGTPRNIFSGFSVLVKFTAPRALITPLRPPPL